MAVWFRHPVTGPLVAELFHRRAGGDRAAVLEAIAVTRRYRAQLRTTIPDRFRAVTRAPRPTLTPLSIIAAAP